MSEDEIFMCIVCAITAVIAWPIWYYRISNVPPYSSSPTNRLLLKTAPLLCAIALLVVLKTRASPDVSSSIVYMMFYTVMGAAWIGFFADFQNTLGVGTPTEAVKRDNLAMGAALTGGMIGATFAFAGANIGTGPGWWVVVFSGLLSTTSLGFLWILIAKITDCVDRMRIDRDVATGVRIGGFLAGSGIILGSAVAGDWTSAAETVGDFKRVAPPVLILLVVEIAAGWALKPTPRRPVPSAVAFGIFPALLYVIMSSIYAVMFGGFGNQ